MDKSNAPGLVHSITAVSNPRIKSIRALSQKKYRDEFSTFLVEGHKLVRDAFEKGWKIKTLIVSQKTTANEDIRELSAKLRVTGTDILEVNEKVLTSISRKDNPQVIMAVVCQQWGQIDFSSINQSSLWIGLDRVRDPGNLGTIIRTADASGASGIVLIGETTDPFSLEATRASMGSIFNIPLLRQTVDQFLELRKKWQGLVIGTHLDGAEDYRAVSYDKDPIFLLMGNEQQGLPNELAQTCDKLVYIPMHGSADSLNLGVATGVMLFHIGKNLPTYRKNQT